MQWLAMSESATVQDEIMLIPIMIPVNRMIPIALPCLWHVPPYSTLPPTLFKSLSACSLASDMDLNCSTCCFACCNCSSRAENTKQFIHVHFPVYLLWFNLVLGLKFFYHCFMVIISYYLNQKQKGEKFKPRIKLNQNIPFNLRI